jgi:hypothetical protein
MKTQVKEAISMKTLARMLLLALVFALAFASISHADAAKIKYLYYPASQVYFDAGRGLYFHCSGGQWHASASLPASVRIEVKDSVSLELGTKNPYEFHSVVVKKYPPGQLKKLGKWKGKGE